MASYTMELRNYIEMWTQDIEDMPHRERIEVGRKHLFDFPYPIWNEAYRKEFETKFIRNFYMREIGFETEELFKMRLENWLAINMPYFNQLLESELLQNGYDPLTNTKMNTTHNQKNDMTQGDVRDKTHNLKEGETIGQNIKTDEESSFKTDEHSQTDRTLDRTQNTDEESKTNQTTDRTENTDGTTSSETDATSTQDQDTQTNGSSFNRELTDNTPDGRLAITANDGTGVINYASQIQENKNTNDQDVNQRTSSTESSGTDTTNEQSTTGKETSESTSTGSQDTVGKDTEKINTTTNITGNAESSSNQDNKSDRDLNRDTIDKDTLDREVNRNEDFVEDRFGKIGINSFASLLIDHRKTFLRIERDIFNEMERLFMGVY